MMRRFTKHTLACVVLLAALAGGPVFAASAGLPSVQVLPLYRLAFKPGLPMPVAVDVDNRAERFQGVLEAWIGGQSPGRLLVSRTVDVGPGRFRFWLYPRGTGLESPFLTVRLDGAEQARIPLQETAHVAMPVAAQAPAALPAAAPQDSTDLPRAFFPGEDPARSVPKAALFRRALWWAGVAAAPESGFPARELRDSGFQLMPLAGPESFPDRWYGFQALDVLFWDAHAGMELTSPQRQAIREWVQAGGRLILAGPEAAVRANAPVPDLLPAPDAACDPAVQAVPGVRVLDRHAGLGLVRLFVCETSDLAKLLEQDWARLADTPRLVIQAQSFGKSKYLLDSLDTHLGLGLSVPRLPVRNILSLLILYGLAISLLDYALLRLFRRLRWTWVTFPSLIVLFSLLAYYRIYRPGLVERAETELVVRDAGPDGAGKITRVACVRLARAHPHVVTAEVAGAFFLLPGDSGNSWQPQRMGDQRLMEMDAGGLRKEVAVTGLAGSERVFIEEAPVPAGAPVFNASLSLVEGRLSGRVQVPAGAGYTNLFLLHDNLLTGVTAGGDVSHETRQIEDLMLIPGRWEDVRITQEETFLDILTDWVDLASEAALCAAGRQGWQGVRAAVLPNDFLARWNAPADQAVLFGFCEESGRREGGPFRRVRCVRQLVPVGGPMTTPD